MKAQTKTEDYDEILRSLNLKTNELKHQYGAGGLEADIEFYYRYLLSLQTSIDIRQ